VYKTGNIFFRLVFSILEKIGNVSIYLVPVSYMILQCNFVKRLYIVGL
jgi:hypothetical protein